MSARTPPEEGWVTVAAAAAALTKAGDRIDASNVSRYLARNSDVPQRREGKFRFVDLAALMKHRNTSIFVADKRDARDLAPTFEPGPSVTALANASPVEDIPNEGGSALQQANVELKLIELRRKQREEAVEQGQFIPAEDLQAVVMGMMEAFTSELSRQEVALSAKLGREAGAEIRKAHRAARSAASARLIEAAREHLKPGAAGHLVMTPPLSSAAA